ncbi:MAG: RES domain-containing protein [Chitinophagaceae bacterium]|nr:MAG: RES domain-containing protein [Chitinophagaceae bacterium]
MIVYRISNSLYSNDISGIGAKIYGARWNSKGTPMLYSSEHISLAVLELLVHSQFKHFSIDLDILTIQLPANITVAEISAKKVKANWEKDASYTQFIGDEFVRNKQDLVLKVPSAVIQDESNFLVNPLHADFKKVKILETRSFKTDERLFAIK